jgi:excisionase family DNA binding protein
MPIRVGTCANPEAFMTPKEGAYLAGISVFTLYDWLRRSNPPPHVRRGRRWLLPRAEFTEWATRKTLG